MSTEAYSPYTDPYFNPYFLAPVFDTTKAAPSVGSKTTSLLRPHSLEPSAKPITPERVAISQDSETSKNLCERFHRIVYRYQAIQNIFGHDPQLRVQFTGSLENISKILKEIENTIDQSSTNLNFYNI